jgi:hypothetical protein
MVELAQEKDTAAESAYLGNPLNGCVALDPGLTVVFEDQDGHYVKFRVIGNPTSAWTLEGALTPAPVP